jgi:hypothetical protein
MADPLVERVKKVIVALQGQTVKGFCAEKLSNPADGEPMAGVLIYTVYVGALTAAFHSGLASKAQAVQGISHLYFRFRKKRQR